MPPILVALLLGAGAVLQATINRQIALRWGLAPAVVLNALILMLGAVVVLVVARIQGGNGFAFRSDAVLGAFRWWWIFPGLIGLSLVALLPWAAHHIGFQRVFVGVVAAQMVTSLCWDLFVEKMPFSAPVALAALLALASVALVTLR